jgi:DNA-binding transcriptional regulator YiaG
MYGTWAFTNPFRKIQWAKKIKKARLFQVLTGAEFAQRLGVNESTMIKWENGKWHPGEKSMKALIQYINQTGKKLPPYREKLN